MKKSHLGLLVPLFFLLLLSLEKQLLHQNVLILALDVFVKGLLTLLDLPSKVMVKVFLSLLYFALLGFLFVLEELSLVLDHQVPLILRRAACFVTASIKIALRETTTRVLRPVLHQLRLLDMRLRGECVCD